MDSQNTHIVHIEKKRPKEKGYLKLTLSDKLNRYKVNYEGFGEDITRHLAVKWFNDVLLVKYPKIKAYIDNIYDRFKNCERGYGSIGDWYLAQQLYLNDNKSYNWCSSFNDIAYCLHRTKIVNMVEMDNIYVLEVRPEFL